MTDRLDDLLRQAGRTYAGDNPVQGPRPDDVDRRSRARRRNQRVLAGGLAALALLVGAAALARPAERAGQRVDNFGTGVEDPAATVTAPITTGTAPPPTTPTTEGPTTTTTATTVASAPSPGASGIRAVDVRAQRFPADTCTAYPEHREPVRIGTNSAPDGSYTFDVRLVDVQYVQLIPDSFTPGLEGSGGEEALVTLECAGGAHAYNYGWLLAVDPEGGVTSFTEVEPSADVLRALDTTYGIKSFEPKTFAVRDGEIISEGRGLKDTDPLCCPSYPRVVLRHRLTGEEFTSTIVDVEPRPAQLGGPGA